MKCVYFNERFNRLYFLDLKAKVKGQKPPKSPKGLFRDFFQNSVESCTWAHNRIAFCIIKFIITT